MLANGDNECKDHFRRWSLAEREGDMQDNSEVSYKVKTEANTGDRKKGQRPGRNFKRAWHLALSGTVTGILLRAGWQGTEKTQWQEVTCSRLLSYLAISTALAESHVPKPQDPKEDFMQINP